ncbi:MAG: 16S rRNA (guanine(527)-N(7))-methyltransferase RsmG [Spirochaetia bacterium]|nr:16S rRNA (guanine(527)-N(7))-methyltransferase RsmG [Spirochaetota bacterium]MCX8097256.1 16S rRNA (guanine(527)-N(7))-methyltransferase RsmG [Spirochaetota bacterium]MDW8111864.1 16S rRNA (guanine(527)-N(7))-methyltransferase RsmG [Spirochaetia bacterium]
MNIISELEKVGIYNYELLEDKVNRYLDTLFEWNNTTNLTSVGRDEFLKKHFLFSYNFKQLIEAYENIFDFGSGNGVPGIPLSLVFPNKKFILVENKKRKIAFLEYVIDVLSLKNVEVIDSSVAKPLKEYLSNFCVVTKAFNDIKAIRKFFNTNFTLFLPSSKGIEDKKTKVLSVSSPKIGDTGRIVFYHIEVFI